MNLTGQRESKLEDCAVCEVRFSDADFYMLFQFEWILRHISFYGGSGTGREFEF